MPNDILKRYIGDAPAKDRIMDERVPYDQFGEYRRDGHCKIVLLDPDNTEDRDLITQLQTHAAVIFCCPDGNVSVAYFDNAGAALNDFHRRVIEHYYEPEELLDPEIAAGVSDPPAPVHT